MNKNRFASTIKLFLLVFICFATYLLLIKNVRAEVAPSIWSWTKANPTVFSTIPASPTGINGCYSTIIQKHFVSGEPGPIDVCMMANNRVSFGLYSDSFGLNPVVSFGNEINMYKVTNVCSPNIKCLYLPDTDTLVRKEYISSGSAPSLVLYRNFSKRLTKYFDTGSLTNKYSFDSSSPDYTFKNSSGYAWLIGGIGASNNGKWLAMEFYKRGMGLLNVETLEMRRISTQSWTYNVGSNPSTEFAVSNDGSHVAQSGINGGFKIFDDTQNCGDIATDSNMMAVDPIVKRCKTAGLDYSDIIFGFDHATQLNFSDDGGELDFFALSYNFNSNRVALRVAGYSGRQLDYLALGDSYSSGEGDLDDSYYINGTNNEFEKCHTSSRSYPFLISDLFSQNQDDMKSVACSGARMIDVIGNDNSYQGQDNRLGIGKLNLNNLEISSYKVQALEQFIPGRTLQNSFVQLYQPSIVTIGIGGNDSGLITKLTGCLGSGTCDWANTSKGREQTAVEIKNLYPDLVNNYKQIQSSSVASKIYVIGYPKIIESSGDCSAFEDFLLDETEREYINETIKYLNQVIESATISAGVEYVDIYDSFGQQVICGSGVSAVNTVSYGDDIGPFEGKKWFRVIGQESFHPNQLGHQLTSNMIRRMIPAVFKKDSATSLMASSETDTSVPEPPTSLMPDGYHNYPLQKFETFIFNRPYISNNKQINIKLADFYLEPNSEVVVEINSKPKMTWTITASSTGSVDAIFNLPTSLDEGIYTFHLLSKSYSGENIDLYQVINYWDENEVIVEPPIDDDNDPVAPELITETTDSTLINRRFSANNFSNYFDATKVLDKISLNDIIKSSDKSKVNPIKTSNNTYFYIIIGALFLFIFLPIMYFLILLIRKIIAKRRNKFIK